MSTTETKKMHYLDMLQGAINRMANNAFKIKNWTIVIFAGLISLYFSRGRWQILGVAMAITCIFCVLDAYYLALEREYCKKHKDVVFNKPIILFDMRVNVCVSKLVSALWSPAMIPYWAIIMISLIIMKWESLTSAFYCFQVCFL